MKQLFDQDILLIYINVALYAACFQMQTPVKPYIVNSLSNDDSAQYGYFSSFLNAIQVVGTLLSGFLTDKMGCKTILILNFVACFVSYTITFYSTSLWHLYVGLLPTIFQQGVLASRIYLCLYLNKIQKEEELTTKIGYIGICYGVGMVIGPFIGGRLSVYSLYYSAAVAAVGSLISLSIIVFLLDDVNKDDQVDQKQQETQNSKGQYNLAEYKEIFQNRKINYLLLSKCFYVIGQSLFHSVFPLVISKKYGIDAKGSGNILSTVGLLGMCATILLQFLEKRISENKLAILGATLLVGSYFSFSVVYQIEQLYVMFVPMVLGNVLFSNISSSLTAKSVRFELKGMVNAIDMSLGSFFRVLMPTIGVYLMDNHGVSSIGIACACANLCCSVLYGIFAKISEDKKKSD